jgi:3-hydroxyisobutyrate dehydrogenase-like beta-hydroxyacid dehydrogenase
MIDGPVGAASAMKMSYAGITKGFTALGAMMMLAASRGGVAEGLRAELERSQPALLPWLQRSVPGMFSKAYRFVGEMEEISDYVSEDRSAKQMFDAFADFYTRIAADYDGGKDEVNTMTEFLKPKE